MPRPSPVSDAVWEVMTSRARHAWALDDLHQAVQARLGQANYSTVFRSLCALEEKGLVDRVQLEDGRSHFELHEDHHEHIRCPECGRVAEVPGCVLDQVPAQVEAATGFRILTHRLLFTGLCPDCAGSRVAQRG